MGSRESCVELLSYSFASQLMPYRLLAQEAKNPNGICLSVFLFRCWSILYMLFAHVMTGVAHYSQFSGQEGIAPVAVAISHMGHADAAGVIQPDYPWLNKAIVLAILFGYCSVIMVTLLGQSRVFLSMSRDGLLPPFFSHINEKFRTPARSNFLFMLLVGLLAAFVPAQVAGEMTSIGTLFAFTLVCAGVLVVRKTMPDAAGFQDTARTVRAGCRYRHLSLYDAFPACRYLDPPRVMDAVDLKHRHATVSNIANWNICNNNRKSISMLIGITLSVLCESPGCGISRRSVGMKIRVLC